MGLLNAIYFYFHYDIELEPSTGRLALTKAKPGASKLFEVHPFLGLNTKNYTFDELTALLDKYFRGYGAETPESRAQQLRAKMGTVKLDTERLFGFGSEEIDFTYLFAGIKLYPPLGFDPWPSDVTERAKVRKLYGVCLVRNIPITVHCSDIGYITDDNGVAYTDPAGHWTTVLSHYPGLRINFAHIGWQMSGATQWRDAIVRNMRGSPRHDVYTDCSCRTPTVAGYKQLRPFLDSLELRGNVMFGSDCPISLYWAGTYNTYLDAFLRGLGPEDRDLIGTKNSERFLFGKPKDQVAAV